MSPRVASRVAKTEKLTKMSTFRGFFSATWHANFEKTACRSDDTGSSSFSGAQSAGVSACQSLFRGKSRTSDTST